MQIKSRDLINLKDSTEVEVVFHLEVGGCKTIRYRKEDSVLREHNDLTKIIAIADFIFEENLGCQFDIFISNSSSFKVDSNVIYVMGLDYYPKKVGTES